VLVALVLSSGGQDLKEVIRDGHVIELELFTGTTAGAGGVGVFGTDEPANYIGVSVVTVVVVVVVSTTFLFMMAATV
jgi:hypothetical protein